MSAEPYMLARGLSEHFGITVSTEDAAVLNHRLRTLVAHAYDQGCKDEREACAKVCEEHPDGLNMMGGNFVACATAIRARGN